MSEFGLRGEGGWLLEKMSESSEWVGGSCLIGPFPKFLCFSFLCLPLCTIEEINCLHL